MIEVVEGNNRVSIFRYPPISIKCPASWVDEATRFDQYCQDEGAEYLRGWNGAKRISKRAFAAYFDLKSQFLDYHHKWSRKRMYTDFTIHHEGQKVDVLVQAIPIKDYKPKIGKFFSCNVWKDSSQRANPLIHVFCCWWTPICFIVGWIDNDVLKGGKQQLKDTDLRPIYEHPILSAIDQKGMYV